MATPTKAELLAQLEALQKRVRSLGRRAARSTELARSLRESEERHRTLVREAEEGRQVLDRLYRIAGSMQASWNREDRLRAFVQGVRDALGFDRFWVALASRDESRLEVVATEGLDQFDDLPLSPASGPLSTSSPTPTACRAGSPSRAPRSRTARRQATCP